MADGHHQRRRNVVDSVCEVGQVAQREFIGPQHVIDQIATGRCSAMLTVNQ